MLDVDYRLLMDKLNAFEEKLRKLENDVFILNRYVDTQLNNKYYPNSSKPADLAKAKTFYGGAVFDIPCLYDNVDPNQAMGMVCSCPKHSVYALSAGSFQDAGLSQQWREPINSNQDAEE